MKYFKKLREDNTVEMIGTSDTIVSDCIEITMEEYEELHEYIVANVAHIIVEEDNLIESQ